MLSEIIKRRFNAVKKILADNNLDALIISDPFNIFYLTGFIGLSPHERESLCLVDDTGINLLVPGLYASQAMQINGKIIKVSPVKERSDLFTGLNKYFHTYSNVGIDANNLSVREYYLLKSKLSAKLIRSENLIENLRLIKDAFEINLIKKAVAITDNTFVKIRREIKPGISELELSKKITNIMEGLGADGAAFETIVANRESSALPHYKTSKNIIKSGILLIDAGAKYKGYNADLTRTFYIGRPDRLFKKRYEKLLSVQKYAIRLIKPGITEGEVHEFTKKALRGDSPYFVHGTGHGVGIEIHELPYLRSGRNMQLKTNMVATTEPGVYYPGWGGIRIEDYLQVTSHGCEVLSNYPKNLENMIITS